MCCVILCEMQIANLQLFVAPDALRNIRHNGLFYGDCKPRRVAEHTRLCDKPAPAESGELAIVSYITFKNILRVLKSNYTKLL